MESPDSNDILYEGYQIDFIYIGRQLFELFGGSHLSFESFLSFLAAVWDIYVVVAVIVSIILVIGIIYAYIRYNQMGELESEMIATEERLWQELYGQSRENNRWRDVQNHIATENPNDWKLAIIEADVMLEEALDGAGYAGTTIGEKLKSISPNALQSLDDAWRAHKVRNQIAHGGTDFVLTKKLANETIVQYRRVFTELGVV